MNSNPSAFSASDLRLDVRADRRLLNRQGRSVRFVAVEVVAPLALDTPGVTASRSPLNLGLVIDASGSMEGLPIDAARKSARLVAGRLSAEDSLSVVSFDSEVTTHLDGRRQDAAGRAAAAVAIESLRAGSVTDLSGGWLRGCECVAKEMEARPGLRNWVVVLSDGQANRGILDPRTLAEHAEQLRLRGLFSSAVGIGEAYSDTQLEAISASGGGRLQHAAEPEEIVELVLAELEEARATVVERCELEVTVPEGFRIEVVGDYAHHRRGRRLTCALGSLAGGARRTAVFKLTCPAGAVGATAEIEASCAWKAAGSEARLDTGVESCRLEYATAEACRAQPRDPELATRIARTWQLAIVRLATRLNQEGKLGEAARLVKREQGYFARYCAGLPEAEELVAPFFRLADSIGEARYDRMSAKEMFNASKKGMRGETEHRAYASASWDSHLPR